jgi:hypothetical protein
LRQWVCELSVDVVVQIADNASVAISLQNRNDQLGSISKRTVFQQLSKVTIDILQCNGVSCWKKVNDVELNLSRQWLKHPFPRL